jgi:hypothetical protein
VFAGSGVAVFKSRMSTVHRESCCTEQVMQLYGRAVGLEWELTLAAGCNGCM